jgi:RNA polymerase sigma-70 factor (ECF subfamily)
MAPYETLDDRNLMLLFQQGDDSCFELLLSRHRGNVIRQIHRMTGDHAAAEDLTQEVFLRVYMARSRYQPSALFTTWLSRIAINRTLNWLRSRKARRPPLSYDGETGAGIRRVLADPILTPEKQALRNEQVERLRKAIEALPERQRIALILHKYQGLDYHQIAARMSTTVPAIKSVLFRTYLALGASLKQ